MYIYVVQLTLQARQDKDLFQSVEFKKGPCAVKFERTEKKTYSSQSTCSAISTIISCGASVMLQGVLSRAACFVWACLSADATYTTTKKCIYPSTSEALETESGFASSAILGVYPDELIRAMYPKSHQQDMKNLIKDASYRQYGAAVEKILKGRPEGTVVCFNRLNAVFFKQSSLEDQIRSISRTAPEEYHFIPNPKRRHHSRQPHIGFVVSDEPIENVFYGEDDVISPRRNGKLIVYTRFADAVDACVRNPVAAENKKSSRLMTQIGIRTINIR